MSFKNESFFKENWFKVSDHSCVIAINMVIIGIVIASLQMYNDVYYWFIIWYLLHLLFAFYKDVSWHLFWLLFSIYYGYYLAFIMVII